MTTEHTSVETPALRGLPMLGHSVQLLRQPLEFLSDLAAQGDVVKIRIGTAPAYVINRHDLVRRVLVTDAHKFDKGRQHEKLRLWFGNGLITSDGEFHRRQRRLVQPAFHHTRIAQYATAMQDIAERRISAWEDGACIELNDHLYSLLLTIAARILFSTDIGAQAAAEMERSLPVLVAGTGWRSLAPTRLVEKLPIPANRRFNQALESMNAVISRVIAEYRSTGTDTGDVLSLLLAAQDEESGAPMSDQQIHDEVMTLMIAGSETTRTAVSWACHLLGRHPWIQRQVQQEVDTVLGDRVAGYADLSELTCTRRVIAETLRLFPPPWMLSRRPIVDVDLGGHHIPAGTTVLYSSYVLHRDPLYYPDPHRFDPDRWRPEQAKKLPREAYVPFGAGIRGCVGEPVAWAQAIIILSTIARHWTLHPAPHHEVRPEAKIILVPDSVPMIPRRRSEHLYGRECKGRGRTP